MSASNLVRSFLSECEASVFSHLSKETLVLEFASHFLDIISPNIKAVSLLLVQLFITQLNAQLYGAKESEELTHLANIYVAFNISLRQELVDGSVSFRLEP